MVKTIRVKGTGFTIRVGECVSINGEVEGTRKTEQWFGKVIGFELGEGEETEAEEVVLSDPRLAEVTVLWFHTAKEILGVLPRAKIHQDLSMLKGALSKDLYLLGTKPASISLETITGVASHRDISALCPVRIPTDEKVVWYRWKYTDAIPLEIEAERWCHEQCPLNRYWKVDEVVWFCRRCEWWYHFDCCKAIHSGRTYLSLQDIVTVPLLKGGAAGLVGTSPLVFAAATVVETIEAEGTTSSDWRARLEEVLGCSVDEFLNEDMGGALRFVSSEVECPECSK